MRYEPDDVELGIGAPTRYDSLPLFERTHCRASDPPTSVEAARKARTTSAAQRATILNAFIAYGAMNADRCDEVCGFDKGTTGRRLHEMQDVLENTHREAPTRRGGKGEVWRVKEPKGAAA